MVSCRLAATWPLLGFQQSASLLLAAGWMLLPRRIYLPGPQWALVNRLPCRSHANAPLPPCMPGQVLLLSLQDHMEELTQQLAAQQEELAALQARCVRARAVLCRAGERGAQAGEPESGPAAAAMPRGCCAVGRTVQWGRTLASS